MIRSSLHPQTHMTIMTNLTKKIHAIGHDNQRVLPDSFMDQIKAVTLDYRAYSVKERIKFEVILKRITKLPFHLLTDRVEDGDTSNALNLKTALSLLDMTQVADTIVLINSLMTHKESHINKILNDFKLTCIAVKDIQQQIANTVNISALEYKVNKIIINLIDDLLATDNTFIFKKIRYSLIPNQSIERVKKNLFNINTKLHQSIPVFNCLLRAMRSAAIGVLSGVCTMGANLGIYSMMSAGLLATAVTYPMHKLCVAIQEYKAFKRIAQDETFYIDKINAHDIDNAFTAQQLDTLTPEQLEEAESEVVALRECINHTSSVLTTNNEGAAIARNHPLSSQQSIMKAAISQRLVIAHQYITHRINLALNDPLQFLDSATSFLRRVVPTFMQPEFAAEELSSIEPRPISYCAEYVKEKDEKLRDSFIEPKIDNELSHDITVAQAVVHPATSLQDFLLIETIESENRRLQVYADINDSHFYKITNLSNGTEFEVAEGIDSCFHGSIYTITYKVIVGTDRLLGIITSKNKSPQYFFTVSSEIKYSENDSTHNGDMPDLLYPVTLQNIVCITPASRNKVVAILNAIHRPTIAHSLLQLIA